MASDRRNLFWTLAHIGLGFLSTLTPFVLIGWFYLILFTNFFKANSLLQKKKPAFFFMLFSYLISFELLDRMAKTSPYIPFELSKYLLIIMSVMGILVYGIREFKGLVLVVCILPAMFYDFSGQSTVFDIVSVLGNIAIGLGLAFTTKMRISISNLNSIIKMVWLGCVASLVYTMVKTPDFSEITFSLRANSDTTAGHPSNQVSTILGLGMFFSFYSFYRGLNFSGFRIFDAVILGLFTFQGLISFSRGGMLVGVIGIFILIYGPYFGIIMRDRFSKNKLIMLSLIVLFMLYGVFEMANQLTGGNLLLRYKGETQGTLAGTKEITLDHLVTGRLGIFEQDINLGINNFFTGVGVGGSRFLRNELEIGTAAHVEVSRLFADHGVLGIIFILFCFIVIPVGIWKKNSVKNNGAIMIIMLLIALLTTFHAAMRTFVTPLLFIISNLMILDGPAKIGNINK
jgi:hypothetical protein